MNRTGFWACVVGLVVALALMTNGNSEERLLRTASKSSVQVANRCTGTVIAPGVVLTASHCVTMFKSGEDIIVSHKSRVVMMRVKSIDTTDNVDLAILVGEELAIPAGISNHAPKALKDHFVIGHPYNTINQVVSFLLYAGIEPTNLGVFDLYSGAVAPGNSGSGIFDSYGEVVGVVLRAPREQATFLLSVTYDNLHKFLEVNGYGN